MKTSKNLLYMLMLLCFVLSAASSSVNAQTSTDLELVVHDGVLEWHTEWEDRILVLNITTPDSETFSFSFEDGELPSFALKGVIDGTYSFSLAGIPEADYLLLQNSVVSEEERKHISEALSGLETYLWDGNFIIFEGSLSLPSTTTDIDSAENMIMDQIIGDDLIVQYSLCVGVDCANGESFGFDTIRLKENNLRIRFNDTSNSAGFPTTDWEITINDSANGGLSYFAVNDIDHSKRPFLIEANARNNAIYIDDAGRVGLGTSDPQKNLQILNSDTPTIRFDQDTSGGYTAQAWDVAAHEGIFFIRDVTYGGKIPFQIDTDSPTNTLVVDKSGSIGMGTKFPAAELHLYNSETPTIRLQEVTGITNYSWDLTGSSTGFVLSDAITSETPLVVNAGASSNSIFVSASGFLGVGTDSPSAQLDVAGDANIDGNLVLEGYLSERSDVDAKENFKAVSGSEILAKLVEMPVTTWNYIDDSETTHIGPMAQDFYGAFGVGLDDKHLSALDVNGVALASIQELNRVVEKKDAEIASLKSDLSNLEARLSAVESGMVKGQTNWIMPLFFGLFGLVFGAFLVKKRS